MLLVFDLDGTLYKTHITCLAVLRELCEEFGLQISTEDQKYLMYTTAAALLDKIAPEMPEEERERFGQEFKWREIELVSEIGELFEGAKELLKELKAKGYRLAICGMGSAEYIDTVLTHCKIKELFEFVYPRQNGKTKSQVLARLLFISGEEKENCVMIGDSITDLTAARDNLLPFIGVSYGYGARDLEGCVMAGSAADLEGIIYQFSVFSAIYKGAIGKAKPLVIGVNGIDTSGKTIFAKRLTYYFECLGNDTLLLHMDDFHNKRERRMSDPSPRGYLDNAFDTEKLALLLTEIRSGKTDVALELLNLETDEYTNVRFEACAETVIILEGVLLYRPPLDEYFGYKIFLNIGFDEMLKRARLRDVPKYGEEFFLDKYKTRYIPAQEIYVKEFSPSENADLLIDNSDYDNPIIRV